MSRHLWGAVLLLAATLAAPATAQGDFDECIVSVLNRTAQVKPDGSWTIQNVPIPAEGLQVRARFTCTKDGITLRAQSEFITLTPNITNGFEASFTPGEFTPIPTNILVTAPTSILTNIGATLQLTTTATLPDGSTADVTPTSTGTSYRCTTPSVATISPEGLITAVTSGNCLFIAQHEGRTATFILTVTLGGDSDGDGIPDDVELDLGLDPNNPLDAGEDPDGDGLTNLEEATIHMTDPFNGDSDGDGVDDGAEVNDVPATDPNDASSVSYTGKGLLQSIEVIPGTVTMQTNSILPQEISRQLQVLATLANNNVVDITPEGTGTTYFSNDLSIVNFGDDDGRIFAGNSGSTTVTVSNAGISAVVPVTVDTFNPTALGFLLLSGYANNCAAKGDKCFVAAGPAGLHICDISDPENPALLATFDTPGNANDCKTDNGCVFVADGTNGLVAIDVSNPGIPTLLGTLNTPGTCYDVTLCGQRAYLADGSAGFHIVDISDPSNMSILGSVDTGGTAFGVDCDPSRNLAVVADGTGGIRTIDITLEAAPSILGSLLPQSGGSGLQVSLAGSHALCAGLGTNRRLVSVNISVPASPFYATTTPPPGNYHDVVVDPIGLALCADIISVNSVHTFNISSPASPVPALLINFGGAPSFRDDNGHGVDVQDGLVFLAGTQSGGNFGTFNSNGGLHIGRYLQISDDLGVAPEVELVAPVDGATLFEGQAVCLEADADDDVGIARVEFFANGVLIGSDGLAPYMTIWSPPTAGDNQTVSARAVDFGNNESALDTVTVDVIPDPPPQVVFTDPLHGATVFEGSTITLRVDATDNGTIARVDYSTSEGQTVTSTTPPFNAQLFIPTGIVSLSLTAVAVDNVNKSSAPATVTVNVIPDPLTTVIGVVTNPDSNPVAGADVTVNGGIVGLTGADGTFLLSNVPTVLGDIVVDVSGLVNGDVFVGSSAALAAVRGGITDVGTIVLESADSTPVTDRSLFGEGSVNINFDENILPRSTRMTTQYQAFGITFSNIINGVGGLSYSPQGGGFAGVDSRNIGNFNGGVACPGPRSMFFTQPVTMFGFNAVTNSADGFLLIAKRNGVQIGDPHFFNTSLNIVDFIGLANPSGIDEVVIEIVPDPGSSGSNSCMLFDALVFTPK